MFGEKKTNMQTSAHVFCFVFPCISSKGIDFQYFNIVGQICAKFRPNCSFSVKSMKFGTETVSKMTKKIGYGGKPEIAVLPS